MPKKKKMKFPLDPPSTPGAPKPPKSPKKPGPTKPWDKTPGPDPLKWLKKLGGK